MLGSGFPIYGQQDLIVSPGAVSTVSLGAVFMFPTLNIETFLAVSVALSGSHAL